MFVMRKLLGVVTVSSLCLTLSFGVIGCTPGGSKTFKANSDKVTLEGKGKTQKVSFGKDVKTVEPGEKDGVKATKSGKDVTFEQTVDQPDTDRTVTFDVKGSGDKEDAKVTVTLKGKAAGKPSDAKPGDKKPGDTDKKPGDTPTAKDLMLKDKAEMDLTLSYHKDAKDMAKNVKIVTFSEGKIDSVDVDPKDGGVTADKVGDNEVKITVTDKAMKDKEYTVKIKAAGGAKGVDLKVKVGAPAMTGFLHDRNDQRFFDLPRQVAAALSMNQNLAMIRRM